METTIMMTLNFGFPSWSHKHEAETHCTFASPVAAGSGDWLPDLLAALQSGNVQPNAQ
jgi:hypothetical protein